jgi:lipid-A-disaccharide synthase-like uncharacterized protein
VTLDNVPAGWLLVGFLGQSLFTSRFIVQWVASEIQKKSVVPQAFWWLSLAGGATLLAYALHRGDLVFILGQAGGLLVYLRNLSLLRKSRNEVVKTA